MQGLWGQRHLRAWKAEEQQQGLRGQQHLRAWKAEEQMQGLRGQRHLRAWKAAVRVQGVHEPWIFPCDGPVNTSDWQQRSERSVLEGSCCSGGCGRPRPKLEWNLQARPKCMMLEAG